MKKYEIVRSDDVDESRVAITPLFPSPLLREDDGVQNSRQIDGRGDEYAKLIVLSPKVPKRTASQSRLSLLICRFINTDVIKMFVIGLPFIL